MRISTAARAVGVGIGATAVMDAGAALVKATTGVPPLDYTLVGRWVGHMPRGVLAHPSILRADPVRHERALGWAAHYAIGTGFASALICLHPTWLDRPTLGPALAVGLGTVAAPWFVMQPAFGMGTASSRAPDPRVARLRSLRAHAIYGVGIWLSGQAIRPLGARSRGR